MKDIKQKLLYLSSAAFIAAKTKYKGGTYAMASDSAFIRDLLAEVVKADAVPAHSSEPRQILSHTKKIGGPR